MADEPKSLAYKFARAVFKRLGVDIEPPPPEPKAPASADYLGSLIGTWRSLFGVELARKARYRDYEEMDYGHAAAQLDALVDACTVSDDGKQYGCRIEAGAKHQGVIDRILERIDLNRQIRTFLRDLAKYGDLFVAPVFDDEYNIVALEAPNPNQMIKNVDAMHRLVRGTGPGKDDKQYPEAFQMVDDANIVVAGWWAWEMRHLRDDGVRQEHLHRTIYSSSSYFEPFRKDWRKLQMVEEGMTIARLVRAYLRFVHYLDHTGKTTDERKEALDAYMEKLKRRKLESGSFTKHPLEVDEDLFLSVGYRQDTLGQELKPSLSRIDTIDPQNRGLANINDVEYLRDKLFLRMSKELVGIRSDREDISQQDVASSRMFLFYQRLLTEDLIWPILRLGLLLKGYVAKRKEVKIIWPEVAIKDSWRRQDAAFRESLKHRAYVEMKVEPRKFAAQQVWGISDDQAVGNLSTEFIGYGDLHEIVTSILADLLFRRGEHDG